MNGKKKNPHFFSHKSKVGGLIWGRLSVRDNPILEGTENQIKESQKAPHVFMELRESAAQEHRATNETWHFNQIRRKTHGFWQEHSEAFQRIKLRVHGLSLWTELLSVLPFRWPERAKEGFNLHFTTLQIKTGARLWDIFGIWHRYQSCPPARKTWAQ